MSRAQTANLLRPRRSVLSAFALGAALVAGAPCAFADDSAPNAPSAEQRKDQAKAKYEQGVELYRNERYADAVVLFLEADALSPSAALSFNIARAYEKLADDAATLRWYRNYLRLNPEAPNGAEVRQSIQLLSQALAQKGLVQITALSTPTGATVAIDGRALGVTPLTIELKPGAHHALVTLRGFADAQRDFALSPSVALDLPFELQPADPAAPALVSAGPGAPAAVAAKPKARGRRFGIVPYVTLGVGAVALGGAALFEVLRRSAQNSARTDTIQLMKEDDLNAMNSRQTTARVLLGAGGVLVATGATLLVFNQPRAPESSARLSTLPGGAAFWFTRSF